MTLIRRLPGGGRRPHRAGRRHPARRRGARGEGWRREADRASPRRWCWPSGWSASGADAHGDRGIEAGGHIGPVSLSVLAQEILPHIREVPVFVAGGLGRGEAILAYLEMGASGAQLGTRFAARHRIDRASAASSRPSSAPRARDAVPSVQLDARFPVIPVRGAGQRGDQASSCASRRETRDRFKAGELTQGGGAARDRAFLGRRAAPRGDRRRCRDTAR